MRLPTRILFFALLATGSQAQQPTPPLDQLLTQVQAAAAQFVASVPSFACDESILSHESHNGKSARETRLEASFRVTRSDSLLAGLTESRDIKTIDGKPAAGQKPNLPLSLNGAFSGALTRFLSAGSQQCFDFTLDDTAYDSPIALSFVAKHAELKDPACFSVDPSTTGKVLIDRPSMQVLHLERLAPQQVPNDPMQVRFVAVDFASVDLNGQSWWLPSSIVAATQDVRHGRSFLFTAHYNHYRRFTVTSTILPAGNTQSPQ